MAGRYERVRRELDPVPRGPFINMFHQVNVQDEDDSHQQQGLGQHVPTSPPPSFRSRASSHTRQNQVDQDLADAFDSEDDSDDEADDRQRLVRQTATPATTATTASGSTSPTPAQYTPPSAGSVASAAATRGRVVGGGVGTDGVFANMSARPEREAAVEKEEMPPVCISLPFLIDVANTCDRHMNKPQRTLHHHTGRRQFWRLA